MFQPGNKLGRGRPRIPPEVKEAQKLTRRKVVSVMSRFINMTDEDLKAFLSAGKGTALELYVASMLAKGIKDGDVTRLDFLLNRTIGKVVERMDVGVAKPYVFEKTDGTKLELGAAEIEDEEDGH